MWKAAEQIGNILNIKKLTHDKKVLEEHYIVWKLKYITCWGGVMLSCS